MKFFLSEKFLTWLDSSPATARLTTRLLHLLCRFIAITVQQFVVNNLSLRSSAMTYTLLLSMVPMLALSTAVVKGLGGGDQLRELACSYIDNLERQSGIVVPPATVQEQASPAETTVDGEENSTANLISLLRSVVNKVFDYVDRTNFATLGSFGIGGLLVTVLLTFTHVESALNTIWKVKDGRSLMRKVSNYLTLLFLFPLSVNIAFAAIAFLKHPRLALKLETLLPFAWMQTLLFQALPVFFITLSLYALYVFFPYTRVKSTPALCGALLAASLWFAIQNIYINLQLGVSKYNAIYGTFASAPLFLVWIYFGWLFVLLGAQVAWVLQHFSTTRLNTDNSKPAIELAAASDIIETVYRHFDSEEPITVDQLVKALPYTENLVRQLVDEMKEEGLLHLSNSDERLLPPTSREQFRPEQLVDLIFGTPSSTTTGGRKSGRIIAAARQAAQPQPEQ